MLEETFIMVAKTVLAMTKEPLWNFGPKKSISNVFWNDSGKRIQSIIENISAGLSKQLFTGPELRNKMKTLLGKTILFFF